MLRSARISRSGCKVLVVRAESLGQIEPSRCVHRCLCSAVLVKFFVSNKAASERRDAAPHMIDPTVEKENS